ncbi:MAG: dTDP-4-amino-4,6-dideoxygalactose transaminase [Legionellaceae bacterium]|nr:dTDP-4-amino-4,6-dideoxygalactose transaminase [Legionellaceae bacterium]
MNSVPFHSPPRVGCEMQYMHEVYQQAKWCGDGPFSRRCEQWLQQQSEAIARVLLTPSCTAALELAALLIDIQPGDEVIMPSYTFVSTANAFVLRGAHIVFVDVDPLTMNLDTGVLEAAISDKTRAIVPVHYAGVACDMTAIMALAQRYALWVVEDAAQGVHARYRSRPLGAIGHLGCYSFHETKNFTAGGEGGALVINDAKLVERAEILREKGTNRAQFLLGQVDKYTWQDKGSSFLPGEFQAACLLAQLEQADAISARRLAIWQYYYTALSLWEAAGVLELPVVPEGVEHNAHLFFCKLPSPMLRNRFIEGLREYGVQSTFHYVPLHSSPAGRRFGHFCGVDRVTTQDSQRLCRLPLWFNMSDAQCEQVIDACQKVLADLGATLECR